MATLTNRFREPLPTWTAAIRNEAQEKIVSSIAARACCEGDAPAIREILIRFWPFVDVFPQIIRRGCARLIRRELITTRLAKVHRILDLLSLLILAKSTLSEIERDETDHRRLWLRTMEALGLSPTSLDNTPIPSIGTLMAVVGEHCDPPTMFLRFAGVEILAESISETLLQSDRFRATVGTKGLGWFLVHTARPTHGEESHESLTYRLAFAFQDIPPDQERVNAIVQQVIGVFVEAGEAIMKLRNSGSLCGISETVKQTERVPWN